MIPKIQRPWMFAAGAILLILVLASSNTGIEHALGRAPHSLAWGPELFRILLGFHAAALLLGAIFAAEDPASQPHVKRPGSRAPLIVGAIIAIAFILRIPGLNSCLWLDEVLTISRFVRPPVSQILTSFPDQNQHMLYSLLAHFSIGIFGESAWALRLPSVLFGCGSIWALFLLGRKLLSESEAIAACALMAVSYHHIWFSQNARGYMGLLFFTLLATWLWLRSLERGTWRLWMAYMAATALGFWVNQTMLFVAVSHALITAVSWAVNDRKAANLVRPAIAFLLSGTLSLQLNALALPEFLRSALGEFSPPSEWTNPLWVVTESIRSLELAFAGAAVVVGALLLVSAGWLDMLKKQPRAAFAMVLPAILSGGAMKILGHNLWPRFFFFCMGFALLIVIHGAMRVASIAARTLRLQPAWGARVGYALSGAMILASATTVPRVYALPKQDFTGARDFVEQIRRPGDNVASVGLASLAYAQYYAPRWNVADTGEQLNALRRKGGRTFVVYTLPVDLRAAHPDVWKVVQADFEPYRIFPGTLGGGDVYVCRERTAAATDGAAAQGTKPNLFSAVSASKSK